MRKLCFFRIAALLAIFGISSTLNAEKYTLEQYLIRVSAFADFVQIKEILESNNIDMIEVDQTEPDAAGSEYPKSVTLTRNGSLIATIYYANDPEEYTFDIRVDRAQDRRRGLGSLLIRLFNEEFFAGEMSEYDWSFFITSDNYAAFEAALAEGLPPGEACWATPIGRIFNNHLAITPETYNTNVREHDVDQAYAIIDFDLVPGPGDSLGLGL